MVVLKKRYLRKRHSVSLLHAHLVFCTKYRRSVMTRRVFDHLRRSMRGAAQTIDIDIIAIQSDGDHLHLMVLYPPSLDLSTIVKRLKGASSRFIRQLQLPEVLRQLWGRHFWSPSYFVVSCGGAPLDVVRTYVESQNDPDTKKRKAASRPSKSKRKSYPQTEVRGLRILDG
jgi:putative transposase